MPDTCPPCRVVRRCPRARAAGYLLVALALGLPLAAQTPPPGLETPPPPAADAAAATAPAAPAEDPNLTNARVKKEMAQEQREIAQTKYYEAQTKELESGPSWRVGLNDFATAMSPLVAIFTALFAVITFSITQRATSRAQRNTEFFEALKQFGDKESATLRASAAGTLAHMGRIKDSKYRWRFRWPFLVREWEPEPYLDTALDQLGIGLQLESDASVLSSIKNNLARLIERDPRRAVMRLHASNLELQNQLVEALCWFYAPKVTPAINYVEDDHRAQAAAVTGMGEETLEIFEFRFFSAMNRRLEGDAEIIRAKTDEKKHEAAEAARDRLAVTAKRLRFNVELYSEALRADPFKEQRAEFDLSRPTGRYDHTRPDEMNLENAFLSGALLYNAPLQGVNLAGGQLDSTTFGSADLRRAVLDSAHLESASFDNAGLQGASMRVCQVANARFFQAGFDDETKLNSTDWWRAGFFDFLAKKISTGVLMFLYGKYGDDVPDDLTKVHASVRYFVEHILPTLSSPPLAAPGAAAAGPPETDMTDVVVVSPPDSVASPPGGETPGDPPVSSPP